MKVLINIRDANEINKVPHIRELIVLSYLLNTNHSARDQYLQRFKPSDAAATMRDNIYGMIQLSSLAYEGMRVAHSILRKLAGIIPRTQDSEIAWLQHEVKSPDSFYSTVMKPIRNELGFHFSHCLANLPLHKSLPHIPPTLAETNNEDDSELIYVLPTDIISSYLLSLMPEPTDPADRLIWIITQLGEYNNRIGRLLREMVYAIMEELQPNLLVE